MYTFEYSAGFKKDFKKYQKKKYDFSVFEKVFSDLQNKGVVAPRYKPHPLKGNWKGCYECHLEGDVLLVWEKIKAQKLIVLIALGSHDELFRNKR